MAVIIVSIVVMLLAVDASLTNQLRHIPAPPAYPIIGHIPYLLKEPWRVFYEYSKRYGAVYLIRLWNKPMLIVSDPELVKTMFRERADIYLKDQWSYDYFRYVSACACEVVAPTSTTVWRVASRRGIARHARVLPPETRAHVPAATAVTSWATAW